ncbi:TRAP transporter small permease subunit [Pelagibius litoralis]|uniref:TRAP transporter small permease protein n=1 Tax=Pelagibius litoralis TaxID=374515 RepID=A0A967EXL6_9PROT|nr:TRAP transporter small permease subunit [Pelagibius litoralis]NIA69287.1 TRAP transporter small permease subunit [Pelagibius litoralis]
MASHHDQEPNRQSRLTAALGLLCGLLLFGLIGLTCVDVVTRYWFNAPVNGAFELTELLLAALIFAALPLTTGAGQHVEVDLLAGLSGPRLQRAMRWLAAVVAGVVLFILAWRLALQGLRLSEDGAVTNSLALPLAPVAWLAALSCAASGLIALLRGALPADKA